MNDAHEKLAVVMLYGAGRPMHNLELTTNKRRRPQRGLLRLFPDEKWSREFDKSDE
jgi:hypothetical protein